MSLAGVSVVPDACSGLTYWAVPRMVPVAVSGAASSARAMPKSVILTWPVPVTSRLPGLTSRWITPARWAAYRPRAVCSTTSSVTSGPSAPLRARMADSGSPRTSSITR